MSNRATFKVARLQEVMEEIDQSGAVTVQEKLNVLFELFNRAARTIDPSIQRTLVMHDAVLDHRLAALQFVRKGQFGQEDAA